MKEQKYALKAGERTKDRRPVLALVHGYLWIGADAPGDMECFGTLSGRQSLRALARAILAATKEKGGPA